MWYCGGFLEGNFFTTMLSNRRRRCAIAVVGVVFLFFQGCATTAAGKESEELPHFSSVDPRVYRGGQPSEEGLRLLARRGVKTIISLRAENEEKERERQLCGQLSIRWVDLPVASWSAPSEEQVRQFLAIASDPSNQPVFVHCRQGKNRTGILVAIYRIAYDGWSPEKAYAEARRLGMSRWNIAGRGAILNGVTRKKKGE